MTDLSIYPQAPAAGTGEEDALDEVVDGRKIIDIVTNGLDREYIIRENGKNVDYNGKVPPLTHILSIVLAGRNSPHGIRRVWRKILQEKKDLEAIDIRACSTQTEFVNEVSSAANIIPKTTWFDKLRERHGVTTFDKLKQIFPDYDKTISTPQNVIAVLDGLSVTVSWDPSTAGHSGVTGYTIYNDGKKIASTSDTSITRENLAYSTTYNITVTATNGDGYQSAPSEAVSLTTEDAPVPEDTLVEDMGLSGVVVTALHGENINTAGDLTQKTEADLLAIDGIGASYVENIKDALAILGLSLKEA